MSRTAYRTVYTNGLLLEAHFSLNISPLNMEKEGFFETLGKKLSGDAARMESSITLLRKPQNSHKPKRLLRSLLKFDIGFGDTQ
jgi:hypothetical protein